MNNILMRILLAVIAIPVLLILIFLLPVLSHLPLNILIAGLSVLGALEMVQLFARKGTLINPVLAAFLSAVFPAVSILISLGFLSTEAIPAAAAAAAGIILTISAFPKKADETDKTLSRLPALFTVLFFPGFFMSYLIRMSSFEQSSLLMLVFLTMVFGNDSFAYIFGMLFGSGNRGIFVVSPKKSLAGLIGGIAVSAAAGAVYSILFPELFGEGIIAGIATGAAIAACSVIGDLVESSMKRSAATKDSGSLMRGRGGVLDTIDSILFSAPLFYYIFYMIK